MNNDDITHNMIIRTIDSNKLPDVENYVRSLHKKGYFAKLIKEGMFTVEEIKNYRLERCVIFSSENLINLFNQEILGFSKIVGIMQLILSQVYNFMIFDCKLMF